MAHSTSRESGHAPDHSLNYLSVFYGIIIMVISFACSLAPVMVASDEFTNRVYILTVIVDYYIYVTGCLWLIFVFSQILREKTVPSGHDSGTGSLAANPRSRFHDTLSHSLSRSSTDADTRSIFGNTNVALELDTQQARNNGPVDLELGVGTVAGVGDVATTSGAVTDTSTSTINRSENANLVSISATLSRNPNYTTYGYLDTGLKGEQTDLGSHVIVSDAGGLSHDNLNTIRGDTNLQQLGKQRSVDAAHQHLLCNHKEHKFVNLTSKESTSPSFYLRIGAVAFGIGAVTSLIFRMMAKIEGPMYCASADVTSSVFEVILVVIKIFYTLSQAFYIFKHSRVSILKWQLLARFGQMHLIATNICDWFDTITQKTLYSSTSSSSANTSTASSAGYATTSAYSANYSTTAAAHAALIAADAAAAAAASTGDDSSIVTSTDTTNYQTSTSSTCTTPLSQLYSFTMPYFAPLIIEYSLIAAVSSYIIYRNIGVHNATAETRVSESARRALRTRFSVDCSKSIRGLFAGMVSLVVSFVVLIVSISNQVYQTLMYYVAVNFLVLTAIFSTAYAIHSIRKLHRRPKSAMNKSATADSIVLVISFSGALLYVIFELIGTMGQVDPVLCSMEVLWTISNAAQSILQVYLIFHSESRYCETKEEQDKKPGRGAVLCLLLLNFSLWVMHSFVVRNSSSLSSIVPLFDSNSYQIIVSVTLPLLIFFRFHSTACLSDAWRSVYSPPSTVED